MTKTMVVGNVTLIVFLESIPVIAAGIVLFAIGLSAFWSVMNVVLVESAPTV